MTYPFPMSEREQELWDVYIRLAPHLDRHCEPMALLFVRTLARYEADPRDLDMLAEVYALADTLWLILPNHLSPEFH